MFRRQHLPALPASEPRLVLLRQFVVVVGVFELGRDVLEAPLHLRDVALEVLAPEEAAKALGEAFDEGPLDLEGVLHHLGDAERGALVVPQGDAAGVALVGAPHLVALGARELGGLDQVDDAHCDMIG